MKFLVVNVAALSFDFWKRNSKAEFWKKLNPVPVRTVFPAVTCPVQASFRTSSEPSSHGVVSNGFMSREIRRTFFWEQASGLYHGERIWDRFRSHGRTVGQVCWQQSIGSDSDMILSPAPIHKHHGGMIQDFYSRPPEIYGKICERLDRKFNLHNYWGPMASIKSSEWISDATCEMLKTHTAPELLLAYIPHLDYDLQRYGPDSKKASEAFARMEGLLGNIFECAQIAGYKVLFFGDYAITAAEHVIRPNRVLLEKGLFHVREVSGMLYPDLWETPAFAMVDHQVAHIYIKNPEDISVVRKHFERRSGVFAVHPKEKIGHPRAGELILEANEGCWFDYTWWNRKSEAPDYASHVDIHNKPGYDPCELFFSFWRFFSSQIDNSIVRGTHGRNVSPMHDVLLASDIDLKSPSTLIEAASGLKKILSE